MLHAVFFFQAEDGIRDYKVTGVQTCALPISVAELEPDVALHEVAPLDELLVRSYGERRFVMVLLATFGALAAEIGRASCRERVEGAGVARARRAKKQAGGAH